VIDSLVLEPLPDIDVETELPCSPTPAGTHFSPLLFFTSIVIVRGFLA
jgi:hypothetical protein